MPSPDTIAVFVPILFLSVIELANISRDTVPLPELAKRESPPIEVLSRRQLLGHELMPNLGRFLLLHWGSMMLLSITVFVSFNFTSGLLRAGLLFAVSILLYLFPIFEISEYDEILIGGKAPTSYKNHLFFVTSLIGFVIAAPYVITIFRDVGLRLLGLAYLWFTFVFLPFGAARSFTIRLEQELKNNYNEGDS